MLKVDTAAETETAKFATSNSHDPKMTLTITTEGAAKKYNFKVENLPSAGTDGSKYTYYVQETNVQLSGYLAPRYSNSGAPSGAEYATNGGTIINKQEGGYVLPETGGHGTNLIYLLGSLLILFAGAALVIGYRRRRNN